MTFDRFPPPQWVTYKSVGKDFKIHLTQLSDTFPKEDVKVITRYDPLVSATTGAIHVFEEPLKILFDVNPLYGTISFTLEDLKRSTRSKNASGQGNQKQDPLKSWRASAGFTFGLHEVGQININDDLFKLVRPDISSPNLVVYQVCNVSNIESSTAHSFNHSEVGGISFIKSRPNAPKSLDIGVHIEVLRSTPVFLPVLLSFVMHSFVLSRVWKNRSTRTGDTEVGIMKAF